MYTYKHTVDSIEFTGEVVIEPQEDDDPIYSLATLEVGGIDLMLVIDPRVVHEIEGALLADWRANK